LTNEDTRIQNAIDVRIVRILTGMTVSIFVLAGSIVWWASEISNRVSTVESGIIEIKAEGSRIGVSRAASLDRLSRLETDFINTKTEVARRLERVEDKLDLIIERLPMPTP
jgi:hypothetical protein